MPGQWSADPTGRHELRYWDGQAWTDHVSDGGRQSTDPIAAPAAPATPAATPGLPPLPGAAPAGGTPPPGSWGTPVAAMGAAGQQVFRVQIPGAEGRLFSVADLQRMAIDKAIQPGTMVQHVSQQYPVPASQIPDVFSDKTFTTAVILTWLLGGLGIDRFYLGYTGLGLAKLFTCGGLGVWSIIDAIMVTTRKIPDAQGRPLA